jgi:hypothetical protein
MRQARFMITTLLILFSQLAVAQGSRQQNIIPDEFCLTAEEIHLYRLINEYRVINNLDIIPLSKSLSYVAHVHVRDLHRYRPDLHSCNLHSWSDKGKWTACCYAKDPKRSDCMWSKPREITNYRGKGQELILWENIPASSHSSFDQWRNFEPTNEMILNKGRWLEDNWQAMGVAVFEGYAALWFGNEADPEKTIRHCENDTNIPSDWLIAELVKKPEEPEAPPAAISSKTTYYLIVSSFKEEGQANNEVKRLKTGGYTDAKVISREGNFRISVHDFQNMNEAQQMRRQLSNVFKGIWILEDEGM